MIRIEAVVGARPNYMKMAPVVQALQHAGVDVGLTHTGQHYDRELSTVFFEELGLPQPDRFLEVGSAGHAEQTARIMVRFDTVCEQIAPELVIVGGDVNSTVATALVAAKRRIPVAHVEAGLRSFDRDMPEEINRVVTDHLSTLLFTTEESANRNLAREGVASEKTHFVGNCMADSLLRHVEAAVAKAPWRKHDSEAHAYGLLTLHRPANVDRPERLQDLLGAIAQSTNGELPILFPIHPRTDAALLRHGISLPPALHRLPPLPYVEFLGLMAKARLVLTDSGGIQEETTLLGVPCLTLRDNTERPVTLSEGTNRLVGAEPAAIMKAVREVTAAPRPEPTKPPLWDGNAGRRIAEVIVRWAKPT